MEKLTRQLIEDHMRSFIDVTKEKDKYGWTLSELADCEDWPSTVHKFASEREAVNAAIGWIKINCPNIERIAVSEAKAGIAWRNK
jgi:hypothetical protein